MKGIGYHTLPNGRVPTRRGLFSPVQKDQSLPIRRGQNLEGSCFLSIRSVPVRRGPVFANPEGSYFASPQGNQFGGLLFFTNPE